MELKNLSDLGANEQVELLKTFKDTNALSRTFDLGRDDRKAVWSQLFQVVKSCDSEAQLVALVACRILSREVRDLNESVENEYIDVLTEIFTPSEENRRDPKVKFEAKQVMSNLIQQSSTVLAYCAQINLVKTLLSAIQMHKEYNETERFDLRLMFILTAKCDQLRSVANTSLGGVEKLIDVLDSLVKISESSQPVSLEIAQYMGELIKLLFNLTLKPEPEDTEELVRLCGILNTVLNMKFVNSEAEDLVVSNVINLLTNLHDIKEPTAVLFLHDDMKNLDKILNFLLRKLNNVQDANALMLREEISPVLMVLWGVSQMQPPVRKHLKKLILPPLTAKDLEIKPEEASTPRGRLVSLLTHPDTEISTMAAEFLFVLCKHNVGKLVKQTGYGNAAGLLARRGLMMGGRGDVVFSSDSEGEEGDEEEEYRKEAHKVNPITGRVEKERANPFAGMTEEQKEYEANKMANMMQKLLDSGFIKPATVGEDGRPREVEHVLQLQEGMNLPTTHTQDDSDSD